MSASAQLKLFKSEKRDNRILVGLNQKTLGTLTRYSKATSTPRSRVVAELIESLEPIMAAYADRVEELHRIGDFETFKRGMQGVSERLRTLLEGPGDEV